MKLSRFPLVPLFVCLLLAALLVTPARAQESDQDDSEAVSLTYGFDANGKAKVNFYSTGGQPFSPAQKQAIGQALQMPLKEHKSSYEVEEEDLDENDTITQSVENKQFIYYAAQGVKTFPVQNGKVVGEIQLAALIDALRAAGRQELQILISHPDLGYAQFPALTEAEAMPGLATEYGFHQYRIELQQPQLQTLAFSFGEPDGIFLTRYGPPIALLIAPLLLMLLIGAARLRKHQRQPGTVTVVSPGLLILLSHGLPLLWWVTLYLTKADKAFKPWLQGQSEWSSTLLSIALYVAPPLVIILLCQTIHQFVVGKIKGDDKSLAQLLIQTALQVITSVVPSLLFIYGMFALVSMEGRKGLTYFALFFILSNLAAKWQWKALGLTPYIVPSGTLRQRIFGLAQSAGVKLREAFLVADTNGRTINAFASSGENILLTEYLLSQFSRREIDFIVGHELTHLQRKHLQKNVWISVLTVPVMIFASSLLGGVMMVALSFMGTMLPALLHWGTTLYLPLSVTFSLGFVVLLKMFLSRRFEYEADAGGASLTNDPEAAITALVKLGKLNLEPMDWGKFNGKLLTHPSVQNRVQAIARLYRVTDEQVAHLMTQLDADPSRYAAHGETNDALQCLLPAAEPKQANLPQSGEPRLLLAMTIWAAVGMILTWVILTPGYAPRNFLHQLHLPAWAVIGTIGLLIAVWFCAHLKKAMRKAMSLHQEFQPVEILSCPAITSAAEMNTILAYTSELEALGFKYVTDYTVVQKSLVPISSFARLFVHPEHHCYAEVSHMSGCIVDKKVTWCSVMSSLTDDLAFSTTNQKPDAMIHAGRTANRFWSCHIDCAPIDLLEVHLEQRTRLILESNQRVQEELSKEAYFEQLRQFSTLRRESFKQKNILRFMYELDTFKRAPKTEWWGNFTNIKHARDTQMRPRLIEGCEAK